MLREITNNHFFKQHSFLKSFFLVICSSCLLILAFPQTNIWIFAWVGLVPLLLAIDGKKPLESFLWGYICGVFFFLGTIYWFIHVTLLGMTLLALYLSLYFALFACGCNFFSKKSILTRLFLLPSLWVVLEFLKGHLLSGFGWVNLGQSQYKNLYLIQIADITGMFGISFLVMMMNVFIKELFNKKENMVYAFIIVMSFFIIFLGYGFYRLHNSESSPQAKIAIIQGNVAQEVKWEPSAWPAIMDRYLALTKEAAKEKPDLIIWPETAFPGFVWESPELFIQLKKFVADLKIPLLLGLVTQINDNYFNSAVLISSEGDIIDQYDKLHLVPFGEYIPFRNIFPFLESIVPIGDFTAGTEYTLFPVVSKGTRKKSERNFSVLICFEDTIPEAARKFTLQGSHLLINITNDAWFQDTKAPFIHFLAAFFRSIENRRTLIRSTNTGVSCFIDLLGRITGCVQNKQGKKTYVPGYAIAHVNLGEKITFYTKFGDVFTYLCFGSILWSVMRRNPSK